MKKTIIIGGGVSGLAAKELVEQKGGSAEIICDDTHSVLPDADLIIASPGVPPLKSGLYQQAMASGIEFIGELEFGFRHWQRPILAITGTNGKTTTTALLTHLLQSCGIAAESAGNIGRPLSDLAVNSTAEVAVVEVSNFQLELAPTFAPLAAALLNLQSDHIDRYVDGFDGYCRVKKQIFRHVAPENRILGLSFKEYSPRRVTVDNGILKVDDRTLLRLDETDLPGEPNAENLAAATELMLRYDEKLILDDIEKFASAVKSFKRAPHRIEKVGSARGITFVNDSKGTNPAAVIAALEAMDTPVILMLGGLAKGMDFSVLRDKCQKVHHAVLFGQDRQEIAGALSGIFPMKDTGMDFEAAFDCAIELAEPGDTILLSPGCASMDMFKNYKVRGEKFRELAEKFINS